MYDQSMAVAFDTLKASRRLQNAGFDESKAEAIVSIFAADIGASLATKGDLAAVRTDLTDELAALRTDIEHMEERLEEKIANTEERLEQKIANTEERLEQKIARIEQRLIIRMGAMVGGGVAVVLAALGIVTGIILAAI